MASGQIPLKRSESGPYGTLRTFDAQCGLIDRFRKKTNEKDQTGVFHTKC